jgi:hypothetical protein
MAIASTSTLTEQALYNKLRIRATRGWTRARESAFRTVSPVLCAAPRHLNRLSRLHLLR